MFILKKKIEKKEQISIDDDKKRENASIENSLMKKVKIKNEFAGEQKKKKKKEEVKKTYTQRVKERMGEHYEEKTFKIHTKRKKYKYGEISNVIKENNKNVKRKKPKKAQTMTAESSKAKTTIIYPRQRKNLRKQKLWKTI